MWIKSYNVLEIDGNNMTLPHIIVTIFFAVILFSRVDGFYPAVGKIPTTASDRLYHWGVGGCHQLRREKKEEKENRCSLLSSSSLSSSSLSLSLSSSISPLNDKNDNEDNNQTKEDKDNNNIHQQIKQKDPIWYKEYVSEIFGNEYCNERWPKIKIIIDTQSQKSLEVLPTDSPSTMIDYDYEQHHHSTSSSTSTSTSTLEIIDRTKNNIESIQSPSAPFLVGKEIDNTGDVRSNDNTYSHNDDDNDDLSQQQQQRENDEKKKDKEERNQKMSEVVSKKSEEIDNDDEHSKKRNNGF